MMVSMGIVVDDQERIALFQPEEGAKIVRLGEGESIEGWTVVQIEVDSVILTNGLTELIFEPGYDPATAVVESASSPISATPEGVAATQTAALSQGHTAAEFPAAAGAEPTVMITLDQLFAAGEVSADRTAALVQLFGLWQRHYDTLAGHDVCAKARQGDLRCLRGKGSVEALAALNRPALLQLELPSGRRLHAVLTALDGTWMTLTVGEHLVRASTKEIAAAWTGEYLLLWTPPAGYQRALRRGSEGATVAWLKNRLAALAGEPAQAAAEATFDAALEAQVMAFQHKRPLLVDGIAGARTLIHLNNALGAKDVAVLAAQP